MTLPQLIHAAVFWLFVLSGPAWIMGGLWRDTRRRFGRGEFG